MKDLLKRATQFLQESHIQDPKLQAEEILASILGLSRLEIFLHFDRVLSKKEYKDFCRSLLYRALRQPMMRQEGVVSFFGTQIELSKDCLIPRQETELLAAFIAEKLEGKKGELWDLCTGSGCLGISIKKNCPQLHVTLSDLSEGALAQAWKNSLKNNVEVQIRKGDLLSPFHGMKADFIVCNPPYISEEEYLKLQPEVRLFDPKLALVSGATGLEFYERLSKLLPAHLNSGGLVFLEIGHTQGEALSSLFSAPCWRRKEVILDLSSRERIFFLEIE